MKKKKTGMSAMDAALSFITSKARTVRETEEQLDSLNYGEYEIYEAIERLKELNYLNDDKYAADFIQSRLASKPVSRRKLREQLYAHKLSGDCIDEAMLSVTDDIERDNARSVADKFFRQFEGIEERDRRQRTVRRLLSRGYEFDFIRRSVEDIIGQVESGDYSAGCDDE